MHQLMAYQESVAPNSVLINVAAVADDTVFTSGDDIRVPVGLPSLLGEFGAIQSDGAGRIQVQAPSLRRMANLDLAPFSEGLLINSPDEVTIHNNSPVQMEGDEAVEVLVYNTDAVAAFHYVGLIFGDGVQQQVNGEIFTVRTTAAMTTVAGKWVSGELAFSTDLPVGNYNVVGMRVVEASSVMARLIFKGGTWRPGCNVSPTEITGDHHWFRRGKAGVWGTFHTNAPPAIELVGAPGAITPEIFLDLIAL